MSIASEITRINNNIASAYTACSNKGATLPATQNSDNLANTISTISGGGGVDINDYFNTTISTNSSNGNEFGKTLFKKIPTLTIANNVNSLAYAFNGILPYVAVFEDMDLSTITDISYMFANNSDVGALDISNFKNASNITNVRSMFNDTHFTNGLLGLNSIDTSNVTDFRNCFAYVRKTKTIDISSWKTTSATRTTSMFAFTEQLAILDISSATFSNISINFSTMFTNCGTQCLQSDGAYADGIPYIYVKDATEQNWVLTASNGHPSTWTTNNVIIKS